MSDLKLGEGTIYHPGGIDFDGKFIWVPVAEYRPNSRSIIYRADLARFRETILFLMKDCCGGRPEICAPLIADLAPCCSPKGNADA